MEYAVRKWFGLVEEVHHDGGPPPEPPLRKAVVAAVVANPYAGGYHEDLSALIDPSPELAHELVRRGRVLLGDAPIESYGKGGIAGTAGEQEHVVACLTTVFGNALRDTVGGGEAWVSSATKVGAAGETLDLPLAYKDALYVRSHYDAVTFRIPDAPHPDELVLAISLATRGRLHHRVGGLRIDEVQGGGLR
jgi:hypothetical protein